jgi:Fic family protein
LYAPPRYQHGFSYEAFVPDEVSGFDEAIVAGLVGLISAAEEEIRSLNDRARPALKPLAHLLLRTESIASSKVEGLQVDLRSLVRAEVDTARRVGRDLEEVLANVDAMELAVEEASLVEAVTLESILAIHRALLNRAMPAIAGQIRTKQNWIGGNDHNPRDADYVPPPPSEVPRLLEDLCELCNSVHLPPLVQAAIVHAQFETIHPFVDGNGRTGRALIHVVLRRRGLAPSYVPPISVFLASKRAWYIEGLVHYRDGDVEAWLERFAVAVAGAASLAGHYLEQVTVLQQEWRERLRRVHALRSDAAAWAVLDVLPGFPVITVPVAVAATGRSKSATSVAMGQLVDAGVLAPVSRGGRNRAWEADGLVDLLGRLERNEPLRG